MKTLALTTAIALGLSAPAFASDQLAASVGVEPGTFTTAELIRLRSALEDNDQSTVNFILGMVDGTPSANGAGAQSIAASIGVDAAAFTLNELVALRSALEDNDQAQVDFIKNGASDVTMSSRRGVSPGHAALAASLGVNAGDFSVNQLVALRSAMEDDDQARVNFILDQAN
jgi:hypothetical protein